MFDTGALQPMLLMTQTILAFETLEVGSCINETAHKALGGGAYKGCLQWKINPQASEHCCSQY